MRKSDDPSWLLYPNTILEFQTPIPFTIDLRESLTPRVRESLLANQLDQPFAIVTACNPWGQHLSDFDNSRLAGRLEAQASHRGLPLIRVDGVSPDRSHREAGVAVRISRTEATTLASQYHQSAFFWFDGNAFWVMPALVVEDPLCLPTSSL